MDVSTAIILSPGVSFADWESDLQAALIKKGRLAHIFHDLDEIKPAKRPDPPTIKTGQPKEEFDLIFSKFEDDLAKWKEG